MLYVFSDYENIKAENAGLYKRVECLSSKIYDLETRLNTTKNELLSYQEQNDKYHENDARLSTLVDLGRQQLTEKTLSMDSLRQQVANLSVERDGCKEQAKTAYQSIATYTAEIDNLKAGKDELERHFYHVDNSVRSFFRKMQDLLGESDLSFERIHEIFDRSIEKELSMKEKLESLQDSADTAELEGRAARETIQRLASEVTNEQQITMKIRNTINERDNEVNRLQAECSALAGEAKDLCGRLEAAKNDKYNLSRILTEKTNHLEAMSVDVCQLKQSLDNVTLNFDSFRAQMAEMVYNDPLAHGNETGDLLTSLRSRLNQIDVFECRIREMSKDLDYRGAQASDCFQQLEQHKRTEAQMAADIRQLRDSLASTEIICEGLREGKENHMRFLEELAHNLKLPDFIEGLSTESAALTRAQQLISMETEAVASRSSQIHMLQRKAKGMKEQMDNKDLHNTMLRKKIIQLEEETKSKSQLQHSQDDQIFRAQKLHKMNDKLSQELVGAKKEIQQLKADHCDFSKREKSILKEESHKIRDLEDTIYSLRETIAKQTQKMNKLKDQKLKRDALINETAPRIETMESHIEGLTQSLEDSREREKQLLDLRETVARLLSLEIASLAVPDYEILSRLESVIHSSNVMPYIPGEDPYMEPFRDPPTPRLTSVTQKPRSQNRPTKINRKLNMKVDPVKY